MVLVPKWPFVLAFLGNIGQENVFYYILERKNAFLGYKIKMFFYLGQFMVWGENWPFFHARKDCWVIIFDRKERFLDKKTHLLKKSKKNRHFPKGLVDGFC